MKFRFLYILFFSAFSLVVLQSRSGGAGAVLGQDRTGSPIGGAAGCSCHGNGSFSPSISIDVKDGGGSSVTGYDPGQTYTIEYTVTAGSGSPGGYAFQSVAILSGNVNAGSMTSALTPNTQISSFGGHDYGEHNGVNATGFFQVSWTAPTGGSGDVTVYARGLAVNGNGNAQGDQETGSVQLVLSENAVTSISYAQASYCQNELNPLPTISGTQGGSFSSSAGLNIASSTGNVNLSTSTPGTYTITYTYSGGSTTTNVTVIAADVATISYPNATYCQNGTNPIATVTGTQGGTFSSSAGLSIAPATGLVDLANSTAGTYTVTYTTTGACPTTDDVLIVVAAADDAAFNYNNVTYCQNGSFPTPTISGTQNGTFSSSAGLDINSSTGTVDLVNSTVGSYTVTYTTNGTCPDIGTTQIDITAPDDASFSYTNATYCENEGNNPNPSISGTQGGTFSSQGGLSVDPFTGVIDLTSSVAGSYLVSYITNGNCPDSADVAVAIIASDDASFNYSSATYCSGTAPTSPTITGTQNGVFSATPAGLTINSSTGIININASSVGTYNVQYLTTGSCPDTNIVAITITNTGDASFNYGGGILCDNQATYSPTITGISGGTFTTNSGTLSLNALDGTIDVLGSSLGTHDIIYTVSGTCSAADTISLSIEASDAATVGYGNSFYCEGSSNPAPTVTGTQGGSFSVDPAGLFFESANTGVLDLANSSTGTYSIVYTTLGLCPDSDTTVVSLEANDDASMSYSSTEFCQNTSPNQSPSIIGTQTGTFSASPAGLSFVSNATGEIDMAASATGTYNIAFITSGQCPDTSSFTVLLEICGGIAQSAQESDLQLYPNPNSGHFILDFGETKGPLTLRFYNVAGKLIYTKAINLQSSPLSIKLPSATPSGIYWLQAQTKEKILTRQILLEK